jgi:hypothetical protein
MLKSTFQIMIRLAQLILFVGLISACGETHKEIPVSAGKPSTDKPATDQKNSFDVPPLFSEQQLKVGQTIEWQRTASNGTTDCLQWKVVSISDSAGISIEVRFSRKCATYDDTYRTEKITFDPADGQVDEDVIITGGNQDSNGPLKQKSVFDSHISGRNSKIDFLKTLWTWPTSEKKEQFPAFQALKSKSIYYDDPGHPFHAFALSFQFNEQQYQYKSSDPALKSVPKDL